MRFRLRDEETNTLGTQIFGWVNVEEVVTLVEVWEEKQWPIDLPDPAESVFQRGSV